METLPYDQALARRLVRPLARTGITPNQLTFTTLALGLVAGGLFATGDGVYGHWAAGIFVLARFLDHFDGELARLTGKSSRLGYYLDYVAGGISYTALFGGIAIGQSGGPLGAWALLLGAGGVVAAIGSLFLNLKLDQQAGHDDGSAVGYPGLAGFELEDGIYLIAPITWLGWLQPFFVAAGIGALCYLAWTGWRVLRGRRQLPAT
jgi:archaetidylinositol phosphate synthase